MSKQMMKVLIACEFSGVVRRAFRARGHEAYSCDLLDADDSSPYHYKDDALDVLSVFQFDLLIAHPPCTYICNSGAKHLYEGMKKENGINLDRWQQMEDGAAFYKAMYEADVEKIAVENPVVHGHAQKLAGIEKGQVQIVQPWQFGHREMKATGLRLKKLPQLVPTDVVGPPPPSGTEERKKWEVVHRMAPGPERWKLRSTTYTGIAQAMAEQWG